MREILFRGKRIVDGEWAYGFLTKTNDGKAYIGRDECTGYWNWSDTVDPATVGQYTGLENQSGQKIFEGDICDFSIFDYNDCDTQYRGVVVYDGSRFMLWKSAESEYFGNNGGFDLDWVLAQDDEFAVSGNRWDNPELLEEAASHDS